jgi:hypothetical protein
MAQHFTVAILEKFKDARVHYAVLKQRTNPPANPGHHTRHTPEGTAQAGMTKNQ